MAIGSTEKETLVFVEIQHAVEVVHPVSEVTLLSLEANAMPLYGKVTSMSHGDVEATLTSFCVADQQEQVGSLCTW